MSFGVHGLNSSYNTTNKKAHVVKVTCVGNTDLSLRITHATNSSERNSHPRVSIFLFLLYCC